MKKLPHSAYPKGGAVQKVVERNGQTPLPGFEDEALLDNTAVDLAEYETWFLMVYVSSKHIQAEVSLPRGVNAKGYVYEWDDRILLPILPNDGTAIDIFEEGTDPGDEDGGSVIEIPVEPR